MSTAIRGISFPWRSGASLPTPVLSDDEAIRENLHQILQVSPYERMYRPTIGCRLRAYLMEPITAVTCNLLREEIRSAIRSQERRITIRDVRVTMDQARATIQVLITYERINRQQTIKMSFAQN